MVADDWFLNVLPVASPIDAVPLTTVNDPLFVTVPALTISVPPFIVMPAVGDAIVAIVKLPVSVNEAPLFILNNPLVMLSAVATVAAPTPLKSKMEVIPDPLFKVKVLKADVAEPLIAVL